MVASEINYLDLFLCFCLCCHESNFNDADVGM